MTSAVAAKLALALALAAGGPLAQADTRDEQVTQTVRDVQRAFARHSFWADPATLEKLPVARTADLFPAFGATPRVVTGLQWTLTPLDSDKAVFCIAKTVMSARAWNQALVAMSMAGLEPAAPATCQAQPNQTGAPALFPGTIAARAVLDRRDTLSPTQVPGYPGISGITPTAYALPSIKISALSGPTIVTVHNPYVEVSPGVGAVIGVAQLKVREGFIAVHACEAVAPGSTCDISISYNFGFGSAYPGELRIEFTNGAIASIGMLGGQ